MHRIQSNIFEWIFKSYSIWRINVDYVKQKKKIDDFLPRCVHNYPGPPFSSLFGSHNLCKS